jgi:hypothetical protein
MVRRKRQLRQLQRQAHASKKDNMISDIMQASENDSKTAVVSRKAKSLMASLVKPRVT